MSVFLFFACQGQVNNPLNPSTEKGSGVIGGKPVSDSDTESKSVVLILSSNASKGSQGLCTGVLISENTVLTAAHCFLDSDYEKSNFHNNPQTDLGLISFAARPSEKRKVTKVITHPKFTGEQWIQLGQNFVPRDPYDIAVLRFEGVKPPEAIVASMQSIKVENIESKQFRIYGFGLTSIQDQEVEQRDRLLSQGRDAYAAKAKLLKIDKNVEFDETWEYGFVLDQRGKDGICWGDSGGPAFIEKDGKKLLVAIVSHRTGRYHDLQGQKPIEDVHPCQYFSVLTRVTMFQNWIKQTSDLLKTSSCHLLPDFKKRAAKLFRANLDEIQFRQSKANQNQYEISIGQFRAGLTSDQFCRLPTNQGLVPEIKPQNFKSDKLKSFYKWSINQSQFMRIAFQLPKSKEIPTRELVEILNDFRQLQITSQEWSSWPLVSTNDHRLIQEGVQPEEAWDIYELLGIKDEQVKLKTSELVRLKQIKVHFNQYTVNTAVELMSDVFITDPKTNEVLILSKSGL